MRLLLLALLGVKSCKVLRSPEKLICGASSKQLSCFLMNNDTPKKQAPPSGISFRPITEGLGFHPFSDGLPYAPVSKSPKSNSSPAGATIAGKPQYVIPNKNVILNRSPQLPSQNIPRVTVPVSHTVTAPPAIKMPVPSIPGWGYVFKRVCAYAFDVLLNAGVYLLLLSQTFWKGNFNSSILSDFNVLFVVMVLFSLINWGMITIEEMVFGVTPGKKLFGLKLKGSAIALFLRALFFIPSVAFFGVGLFWAIGDRRKCCWHDRLLDIQPVEA